jgi:hypothetical protein
MSHGKLAAALVVALNSVAENVRNSLRSVKTRTKNGKSILGQKQLTGEATHG